MKTLGVIANCTKPRAPDVLRSLMARAAELGLDLLADAPTAEHLDAALARPLPQLFDEVDAVMALGGDGTMLRIVRDLAGRDIPVMGVNIGSLGFLTSIAEEGLSEALACIQRDDVTISEHSLVQGTIMRDGAELGVYRGLNEIALLRGPSARVVTLDLVINDDPVTSYVCDGIIVATPTGSTGHSLSAGGPILTPRTPALVISVICPHTLSSRPLIIPEDSDIRITPEGSAEELLLSADGQVNQRLFEGDSVLIRRAERRAKFLHLPGHSYFSVLRQKLNWSGHSV